MGDFKINFSSWKKAASVFEESGSGAANRLSSVVSSTTDPGACGAAGGLATVDGAVAIMLSVFGEVMQGSVVPTISEGLASESQALTETAISLRNVEDDNTDAARQIEGLL